MPYSSRKEKNQKRQSIKHQTSAKSTKDQTSPARGQGMVGHRWERIYNRKGSVTMSEKGKGGGKRGLESASDRWLNQSIGWGRKERSNLYSSGRRTRLDRPFTRFHRQSTDERTRRGTGRGDLAVVDHPDAATICSLVERNLAGSGDVTSNREAIGEGGRASEAVDDRLCIL